MSFFKQAKQRYRYSIILLRELVRYDFKVRYQNSILGYLWSLLRPLFYFLVMYVVFVKLLRIGSGVPHWPVALLLGLVMWEFFSEVTKQGLKAIVSNGGLIRKINFPKYIIMVSSSLSSLINLLLNLVVVAFFVVLNHVPLSWTYLLIPFFIIELYLFALGISFLLAALYVKFRDLSFIWEIVMRAGMYATAVMFPMSRIFHVSRTAGQVMLLSPIAQIIEDSRHELLPHTMSSSRHLMGNDLLMLVPLSLVVILLAFGAWYFRRRSPYFAEDV
ncbi:MAG TPA: ABC transporter permease [Candidatus Saccharimonadales bacterium]|nr:ABC transporter permease [Candidatus Saccharimonadales bacterium]